MKKITITLAIVFLYSCQHQSYTKKYIVTKSDDDNWTTSGIIECDSVTMINKNKATLWIDGSEMNLEGQLIKIFSNENFKK